MTSSPLPSADLEDIVARTPFSALNGARIFITGGTGFFGRWLVEPFLLANHRDALGTRLTILTRDAAAFRARAPQIADDEAITLIEGDATDFKFPAEPFTHVLHAATDSVVRTTEADLAQSIVAGTQHVLALARHAEAKRLLYVSSGAVYGRGIDTVDAIPETFPIPTMSAPTPANYDEAKRISEALVLAQAEEIEVSIARCFAFVGPLLPLDAHFAIGNFIRDALNGTPIHIKGDGTPLRSFLYMSDLSVWLWTMLAQSANRTILNVGSDEAVSVAELARMTGSILAPELPVTIAGIADSTRRAASYVPDISAARANGLTPTVGLAEAIRKTVDWHLSSR